MNEGQEISQPEDIRRKIDENAAVKRGELWESMGCPQSKIHMPLDEYMKTFRGRNWFVNRTVFEQAQLACRIIICPKCIKEADYGGIEGTQFFTTIEDDVMTVFPAVGHFLCHWCGFEEYHPLKKDMRVRAENVMGERFLDSNKKTFVNQATPNHMMGQGLGSALGGPMFGSAGLANQQRSAIEAQERAMAQQANINAIQQAYAAGAMNVTEASKAMQHAITQGIDPGMGPIYGTTEDEQRALYRLWQRNKKDKPPTIVESRSEAESLAKMPAIERRQYIIQKLRDQGLI